MNISEKKRQKALVEISRIRGLLKEKDNTIEQISLEKKAVELELNTIKSDQQLEAEQNSKKNILDIILGWIKK